jgi:hypothetical protein
MDHDNKDEVPGEKFVEVAQPGTVVILWSDTGMTRRILLKLDFG